MSADRPLATRLTEPVFPDKPWSPNIGQVMALISITSCEPIKDNLTDALISPFPQEMKDSTKTLLQPFNDASPETKKALKQSLFQIVRFNIVHTPNYASSEEVTEARCNLLGVAVAQVGLEMLEEI